MGWAWLQHADVSAGAEKTEFVSCARRRPGSPRQDAGSIPATSTSSPRPARADLGDLSGNGWALAEPSEGMSVSGSGLVGAVSTTPSWLADATCVGVGNSLQSGSACQTGPVSSSQSPRPGDLLVATAGSGAGFFDQSCVLLLDCDQTGSLGVALNKLTETEVGEVLPGWEDVVTPPAFLFAGGPVSPNGAICVAKVANPGEEPPGWRPVRRDLGLLHLDTPIELVRGTYTGLRVYAGYSGWESGQLEDELERGLWFRTRARDEEIFSLDCAGMWRRSLRRLGGMASLLSTWTADPSRN